ncbi:DUF4336 domain-containing protein [uncultured Roseovarius sp.]|uniref:DUF4336 domain-containing protein n=1 Tax=Roseovarius sp. TaxID=1486281 RepID=UPI0025E39777|nr:DUF4336 domain-containing protein [uncultured Roseovarius sp.]
MTQATGYEPLNTLKPLAEGIWLVDGPAIRSYGFPFSTRATVVRLENGDLWVHSPTRITEGLCGELDAIGPVAHLIAPNALHFAHLGDWQERYPRATAWAAPGVVERAARNGLTLAVERKLRPDRAEAPWKGQLEQLIVAGSKTHREAVFFHKASRTLILTDLIENIETARIAARFRPFVWLNGIDDTDGKMPPILRWGFRDKEALADSVEAMIGWAPERIVLAHGRCYLRDGVGELERAFRRLLRVRKWDRVIGQAKKKEARARQERR